MLIVLAGERGRGSTLHGVSDILAAAGDLDWAVTGCSSDKHLLAGSGDLPPLRNYSPGRGTPLRKC